MERELKRLNMEVSDFLTEDKLSDVAKKFAFGDVEDMLSAVGFGGITASQIANKLTEKLRREQEEAANHLELSTEMKEIKSSGGNRNQPTNGVRVKGIDNLLVRFARCCNPYRGTILSDM